MRVHRHQPALDQVGLGRTLDADGDVGLAHAEIEIGTVGDQQGHRDLGIAVEELRQMRGEPDRAHADGGVDPQMTGRRVAALGERRLHARHALGDVEGGIEQDLALLGQHEPARMAMEQRGAQILLERPDLPADGGLAEAKPLGRAREASRLRHGVKNPDAIPIQHSNSLRRPLRRSPARAAYTSTLLRQELLCL